MILVRLFAAAEAAAGTGTEKVEAATLGELKAILVARPAVDHDLTGVRGVDVLPPFAGG